MNRILSSALFVLFLCTFVCLSKSSSAQSCGCNHILKPARDGGIYFTNSSNGTKVLPGEKVCIQGGYYPYISLNGLVGTASQPITIINCGGQVIVGSGATYCYRIVNSRYIKFTGTGTSGIKYGFKSYWPGGFTAAGMSVRDSCSDYEIDHFEAQNSQNGFLCKIDPYDCEPGTWSTGWTIKNVSIHDNYVHNTIGEGMYLINTATTQNVTNCNGQTITIEPVEAVGMKVYNNIVDSTGWDGIQVAASKKADLYNNTVTNYGMQNLGSQQAGIILGAKSDGAVHDNYIGGGTGEGLEVFGSGLVSIYNNVIANAGWDKSSAGQDAIAVDDRPQPNNKYAGLKVYIMNNTVINAARNAVHLFNSYNTMAQGNKIYNNLLVKPNNTSIYDNPYTNIDGNTNVDTLNNVKVPVIANAFFVNAGANNFHLKANSPAIDKGLNALSYGITNDNDGLSRPQGKAFDAGAYEYNFGTPPPNIPPVANAGADKTITLPTSNVSLNGSGTDADGTISSYLWTKISGPASAVISNTTSANTTVTSLSQGIYLFELKVTDNKGAAARDTMQVTVNKAANIPPVANAGADKIITLPTSNISLSGSGTDADGTISSYLWTKISGPSGAKFSNANSANTTVTSLSQGIYLFELKVTDNNGAAARDTMQVTVNKAANIPPVANAGADKIITLPTSNISLSGSGTDADGTISSYLWTKISGPSGAKFSNANSANTTVTSLSQGIYLFELKVTDNKGAATRDTMQVTVNKATNIPPVANAGTDKIITLPTSNISLSGSGTDADGTISSYLWTKISGPSGAKFSNANSANTTVTSLSQGIYLFELKVTDNKGAATRDTMQVTVNRAANIPPVANAGTDKIITLPTSNISLSGSGTDADGTISSYLWTKISGPAGATFSNANSANTNVTSLVQGIYRFELKVTDNNGAAARDTMQVTVNKAANIPPVANAGSAVTITLPVSIATLAGSGIDPDGTISSYKWRRMSGPLIFNIVNVNSPVTDVSRLVQGVYVFELRVMDNSGAKGYDSVVVTVNAPAINIPPVANAGVDQTIALPMDSATLIGSGIDADGLIKAYSWKQIAGPSSSAIIAGSAARTLVSNLLGGNYYFELTVTDNLGATAKDTVTVAIVVATPRISLTNNNRLKVYPNPVKDIAILKITTAKSNANLLIVVTDMQGKTVYTQQLPGGQSTIFYKINMGNLPQGIYNVTVYFKGNENQSVRVLKN